MSNTSKESQAAFVHQVVREGLDSQLKTLLLTGDHVSHNDGHG